jgi:hypothetical protein
MLAGLAPVCETEIKTAFKQPSADYSIISEKAGAREKSFSKGQILLRGYYREGETMIVIKEMTEDIAMRLRQPGY